MTNFEKFHFFFKDMESPTHYLDWNFYFMISSCLARRVWFGDNEFPIFPNLYLIFVGPPSLGKSLPANKCKEVLSKLETIITKPPIKEGDDPIIKLKKLVQIAPDSCTLESLWEALSKISEGIPYGEKPRKVYSHASLCFYIGDELGNLFRENTQDLVKFLTAGFDCGNFFRTTKHCGIVDIRNMCINLLGCCTPNWIQDTLSDSLIEEGFSSRVIFLWGEKKRQLTPELRIAQDQKDAMIELHKHLMELCKLFGEAKVTPEAKQWFNEWYMHSEATKANNDPKLAHYYGRKKVHLRKLAMILHFSEKTDLLITVDDYKKALIILDTVEMSMHKALGSKNRNPISTLANAILMQVKSEGPTGAKKILVTHYNGGNKAEIEEALSYLTMTDQLVGENNSGGGNEISYKLPDQK